MHLMVERGRRPWGAAGEPRAVLGASTGWLLFVLLSPAAVSRLQAGWRAGYSRQSLPVRATGWGLVALSIGAIAVDVAFLAAALGG